jgi:hypothetical protein
MSIRRETPGGSGVRRGLKPLTLSGMKNLSENMLDTLEYNIDTVRNS